MGKALLERNQDLEAQLAEAEALAGERQAENQFLTQKLATLRSLNESRMKMYEQVRRIDRGGGGRRSGGSGRGADLGVMEDDDEEEEEGEEEKE